MGLFDYVNYKTTCPVCHVILNDFQTKDKSCMFDTLNPYDVNTFYTCCTKCGTDIEFSKDLKSGKFERIVTTLKNNKIKVLYKYTKLVNIKEIKK